MATEKVTLRVRDGSAVVPLNSDSGNPYYVGARAYVEQNEDGATVTVIDKEGTTTATVYNGQDGETGATGADGFSPIATVEKVGDTTTITITDINGTTTASVVDGSGASAFIAEYGVTSYADVKDAYDNDSVIICVLDDGDNTWVLQLAYFDSNGEYFAFVTTNSDGAIYAALSNADGWDDGVFQYASQDLATSLRDGLMYSLDKVKLDGIASGAEANVQSDWSQNDNTADDFIKNKPTLFSGNYNDLTNKPTIPSNVSDLINDSGFSSVSISRKVSTGENIADITINGTTTELYAPTGGGGTVTDVQVDGSSVVDDGVAEIDLTGKADIGDIPTAVSDLENDAGYITGYTETDPVFLASAAAGITSSDISAWNGKSDFSGDYDDLTNKPTIPTITDTYSGTSSNGMSGIAVKSAIDALDGTISGSAGSGKTLTAFSQTDGKVSATFGNISITKSQISDFPTIPTVNNATLTIQKNGTNVATFTANASSDVTANISVPTTAADVGAVPTTRTVNGKALSSDITLSASDVSALPSSTVIPSNVSDLNNDSGFLTLSTLPIYNGGVQ